MLCVYVHCFLTRCTNETRNILTLCQRFTELRLLSSWGLWNGRQMCSSGNLSQVNSAVWRDEPALVELSGRQACCVLVCLMPDKSLLAPTVMWEPSYCWYELYNCTDTKGWWVKWLQEAECVLNMLPTLLLPCATFPIRKGARRKARRPRFTFW